MKKETLQKIKKIVKEKMKGVSPSHDFSHVIRVYNLCLSIAKTERRVNLEVLKIAALLHDIVRGKEDLDKTGKIDHAILSAKIAEKILKDLGFPKEKIEKVKHCIKTHRFKAKLKPKTIEAKILFDADKLDVCGAIGITRSACWIGENKAKIYSDIPLEKYIKENILGGKLPGRIINSSKHALNIEYKIKLKNIQKRLFTKRAKEIARERAEFMKQFFERLEKEIKGEL
jgi:uncharacterized protein